MKILFVGENHPVLVCGEEYEVHSTCMYHVNVHVPDYEFKIASSFMDNFRYLDGQDLHWDLPWNTKGITIHETSKLYEVKHGSSVEIKNEQEAV